MLTNDNGIAALLEKLRTFIRFLEEQQTESAQPLLKIFNHFRGKAAQLADMLRSIEQDPKQLLPAMQRVDSFVHDWISFGKAAKSALHSKNGRTEEEEAEGEKFTVELDGQSIQGEITTTLLQQYAEGRKSRAELNEFDKDPDGCQTIAFVATSDPTNMTWPPTKMYESDEVAPYTALFSACEDFLTNFSIELPSISVRLTPQLFPKSEQQDEDDELGNSASQPTTPIKESPTPLVLPNSPTKGVMDKFAVATVYSPGKDFAQDFIVQFLLTTKSPSLAIARRKFEGEFRANQITYESLAASGRALDRLLTTSLLPPPVKQKQAFDTLKWTVNPKYTKPNETVRADVDISSKIDALNAEIVTDKKYVTCFFNFNRFFRHRDGARADKANLLSAIETARGENNLSLAQLDHLCRRYPRYNEAFFTSKSEVGAIVQQVRNALEKQNPIYVELYKQWQLLRAAIDPKSALLTDSKQTKTLKILLLALEQGALTQEDKEGRQKWSLDASKMISSSSDYASACYASYFPDLSNKPREKASAFLTAAVEDANAFLAAVYSKDKTKNDSVNRSYRSQFVAVIKRALETIPTYHSALSM